MTQPTQEELRGSNFTFEPNSDARKKKPAKEQEPVSPKSPNIVRFDSSHHSNMPPPKPKPDNKRFAIFDSDISATQGKLKQTATGNLYVAAPPPAYSTEPPLQYHLPKASKMQAAPVATQPVRYSSAPRKSSFNGYPSKVYQVPDEDEVYIEEPPRQATPYRLPPEHYATPTPKSQVFNSFSPHQQEATVQPHTVSRQPNSAAPDKSSLPPKLSSLSSRPQTSSLPMVTRDTPSFDTSSTRRDEMVSQSPNRTFIITEQPSIDHKSKVYLEQESRINNAGSVGYQTPRISHNSPPNNLTVLNQTRQDTFEHSLKPVERYTRVRRYSYNEFGEKQLMSEKELIYDDGGDAKSSKIDRAVREIRGDNAPKPILKKPPVAPNYSSVPREAPPAVVSRIVQENPSSYSSSPRDIPPKPSATPKPAQPAYSFIPRDKQIHFAANMPDDSSSNSSFTNDYEIKPDVQKDTVQLSDGGTMTTYVINHPPKHVPVCKTWISQGVQVDTISEKYEQPPPPEIPPLRTYELPKEYITYENPPPSTEATAFNNKSIRLSSSASGLDTSPRTRRERSLVLDTPPISEIKTPAAVVNQTKPRDESPKFTPTVRVIKKEPIERRDPSPVVESKFSDPSRFDNMRVGDIIERAYLLKDNGDVEEELFRKTETSVRKEMRVVVSQGELYGTFRLGGADLDAPIKNRPGKRVRDYVKRMPNSALNDDPSVRKRVETSHIVLPPQESFRKSKIQTADPKDNLYDSFQTDSKDGDKMNQFMRDDESDENTTRYGRGAKPLSGRPNKDSSSEAAHFMMTNPNSRPASGHSGAKNAQQELQPGDATPGFKGGQHEYLTNRSPDDSRVPNSFSQAAQDVDRMTFSGQRTGLRQEPVQEAPQTTQAEKKEPIRLRFQIIDGKRIPIAIDNENLSEKEKKMILENYLKKEGFTIGQIEELLNKGKGRQASPPPQQSTSSNMPSMSNLPTTPAATNQGNFRQQANQSRFPGTDQRSTANIQKIQYAGSQGRDAPGQPSSNLQGQSQVKRQPDNMKSFNQQQFESMGMNEENSFGNSKQFTSEIHREERSGSPQFSQPQSQQMPEFEKKTGITESNLSGNNGYPGPQPEYTEASNYQRQRSQSPPVRRAEETQQQPSSPTLYSSKASDGKPKIVISPPQSQAPPAYSLSKLSSTKKAQQKMHNDLEKTESLPFQIEEEDDEHRSGIRGVPRTNNPSSITVVRQNEADLDRQRKDFGLESNISGMGASSLPRGRNNYIEQNNAPSFQNQRGRDPERMKFESQMSSHLYDDQADGRNEHASRGDFHQFEDNGPQMTKTVSSNQAGSRGSP